MDYTTLTVETRDPHLPERGQMHSLYEVCQQVKDGRAARGKQYEVAALLVLLLVAKLAGEQSLLGASEWIRLRADELRTALQLEWKQMPCANTYRYALARLSSQQVNALLAAWFVRQEAQRRCGDEPSRLAAQSGKRQGHVAIDGKVLKGTGKQTYGGEDPQQHVLHVYEVQTGIVLEQCPIGEKHNEVSALKPLLTPVLCKGRILTADAAQSYHEFGRVVQQAGGDVVLFIKDNTPATRADLELFFEDPQADRRTWQAFEQREKGHGRLERRSIVTSPDLNEYLYRDWGEVGQVFRLQRERTCKGKHSVEVVYGWTSLSPKQCSPQRLLGLIRAHWAVENRLHWRRDATLGEDRCGVRLNPVAEMLAVLNTVVLSFMDLQHVSNVARQLRRFSAHPREALAWVLDHDF
jgi:predicted transposase YbfD/YdcC